MIPTVNKIKCLVPIEPAMASLKMNAPSVQWNSSEKQALELFFLIAFLWWRMDERKTITSKHQLLGCLSGLPFITSSPQLLSRRNCGSGGVGNVCFDLHHLAHVCLFVCTTTTTTTAAVARFDGSADGDDGACDCGALYNWRRWGERDKAKKTEAERPRQQARASTRKES